MRTVTFKTPKNLILWDGKKGGILAKATDGEIVTSDDAVITRCEKEGYEIIKDIQTVDKPEKKEKPNGKIQDGKKSSDN